MCGIFGVIPKAGKLLDRADLNLLIHSARQRGRDSSGLLYKRDWSDIASADRADFDISRLIVDSDRSDSEFLLGHSRLITNSDGDNQPVIGDDIAILHNGIIVNEGAVWNTIDRKPKLKIDTEVILGICEQV